VRWLLLFAVACSTPESARAPASTVSPSSAHEAAEAKGTLGWTALADGIDERIETSGDEAAIFLGGHEIGSPAVRAWAEAVTKTRLPAVRRLYAVRGPDHPQYKGARLPTERLAASLGDPQRILVAHSSGSFVAHELLAKMSAPQRRKVTYFDLDGAGGGLTPAICGDLARVFFVYAKDGKRSSRNADAMIAAARRHKIDPLVIDTSDARCPPGSRWCLHLSLLSTRPDEQDVQRSYFESPRTTWLDAI
jgi:hypothetical protein